MRPTTSQSCSVVDQSRADPATTTTTEQNLANSDNITIARRTLDAGVKRERHLLLLQKTTASGDLLLKSEKKNFETRLRRKSCDLSDARDRHRRPHSRSSWSPSSAAEAVGAKCESPRRHCESCCSCCSQQQQQEEVVALTGGEKDHKHAVGENVQLSEESNTLWREQEECEEESNTLWREQEEREVGSEIVVRPFRCPEQENDVVCGVQTGKSNTMKKQPERINSSTAKRRSAQAEDDEDDCESSSASAALGETANQNHHHPKIAEDFHSNSLLTTVPQREEEEEDDQHEHHHHRHHHHHNHHPGGHKGLSSSDSVKDVPAAREAPPVALRDFRTLGYCCHRQERPALLATGMGSVNLKGLVNLLLLVLAVQNAQLIVDNILKYGIVVSWVPSPSLVFRHWISLATLAAMHLTAVVSLHLERRHGWLFLRWLSEARASEEKRNAQLIRRVSRRLSALNIELTKGESGEDDEDDHHRHHHQAPPSLRMRNKSVEKSPVVLEAEQPELHVSHQRRPSLDVRLLESVVSSVYQKSSFHLSAQHVLLQALIGSQIGCTAGLMLLIPFLVTRYANIDLMSNTLLLIFSVTWFLKLVSFHHVMSDLREALLEKADLNAVCFSSEDLKCCEAFPQYPTTSEMLTFLWMPTLCFQFSYPRTSHINWTEVLRHAAQGLFCVIIMKIIVEQYITIIVHKTFTISMMEQTSLVRLFAHFFERTLKLSIPSLYFWVLMFVAIFHHWLLILAELTRFADRHFYLDWWNASGIGDYWRKWNLPVHYFCTRHIYKPLMKRGFSPFIASQVIFLLSAVAHEYLVCTPLKMGWTGLVFTAFIAQTPASIVVDYYVAKKSKTLGNLIFWVAFCFTGQPVAILVYYYLWGVREGNVRTLSSSIESLPVL